MRSTRVLALAVLVALPFTATAAGAAPATPHTGSALSKIDTRAPVIDVRRRGGGGGSGLLGRSGGGPRMGMRGGGHRFAGSGGRHGAPLLGRSGGGRQHWQGGGRRHWHGGGGHRHRFHHHFRPRWYGAPYYYYDYAPSYYYDDYYDDDYDDAVVYADDAVERCAARYRSFDRRTGTFLGNDGRRHLCPYLR
ncbi:BA14K family protein [Hyphomicrobium sp.]|uniref:BA14K family protein n=1 Tax=Hyphomicrobium sp. TaxID=82 RepID=UPI0025BB0CCB|nr:BA14K family protein [Hyphomicrobium sp.]MCC7253446.1 BA14K family protein [Hyphomicrobium sp.]